MTVTGHPRDLPAVTDLSAYRIIQEALTNAISHAGPATAALTVRYAADGLAVEVTDTGCGLSSSAAETAFAGFLAVGTSVGHGLRGMRERAAAAGGVIEIGPLPDLGFRVAAHFPLDVDAQSETAPEPAADQRRLRRAAASRAAAGDPGRAGRRPEADRPASGSCSRRPRTSRWSARRSTGKRRSPWPALNAPTLIMMDIRMPEVDGLEATRRIAADGELAGVKVVILTTFETDDYVYQALRGGASGFLVKDAEPEDLIRAVRVAARGEALLSPSVTRRLIATFAGCARRLGRASGRARPKAASVTLRVAHAPAATCPGSPSASARSCRWSPRACPTTRSRPVST